MGRVKIAKKSTFIDMTAMSDVTVLLLTFFMLTSTFLAKEPTQVITPPSVSEEKVQETNYAQVLISPDADRVWITMMNDTAQAYSNEKMRMELLDKAAEIYNDLHPSKQIEFTPQEKLAFSKLNSFGVPMSQMNEFLKLAEKGTVGLQEMDQWLAGKDKNPNHISGIPVTWNQDNNAPNEFQIWMKAIRQTNNPVLQQAIKDGTGVTIKADQYTPFKRVHTVMDNLQTIHMNKFTLLTALKEGD